MLLTKRQIPEYLPLTLNIADAQINPHILDAETFDLNPLFEGNESVLDQIRDLLSSPNGLSVRKWSADIVFNPGDFIAYRDFCFICNQQNSNTKPLLTLAPGNVQPDPNDTVWKYDAILSAYHLYVVPFMACASVLRYTVYAGRNLTQYGITVPAESGNTSQPADSPARAEIQADIKGKKGVYESRLRRFLVRQKLVGHFNDYYLQYDDWRIDYYNAYGDYYRYSGELRDRNDFGIYAI